MTRGVRDRVWEVLEDWFAEIGGGSIIMTWHDPTLPGGQDIRVLGGPACELVDYDGVFLVRKRDL